MIDSATAPAGSDSSAELQRPAGRTLQFFLLTIVALIATMATRAVSPLQESMRQALSLSDNQMALLQGPALALPVVLAAIPLGFIIDRNIRVRLLLVFAVIDLAGCLLSVLAPNFLVLFLARSTVGLMTAAITITLFSLLADLYPPAQRGRAKAVMVIGQHCGTSLAFALGGVLLVAAGADGGWRWAMFWLTGPALLLAIVLMLTMREPPRTGVRLREPTSRAAFEELWQYGPLLAPLMIGIVLAELALFAALTWAAPALMRGFPLAPDRVGAIMGLTTMIGGILGPLVGGTLADLCHRSGGPRLTTTVLGVLPVLGLPGVLFAVVTDATLASILLGVLFTMVNATMAMGITMFTVVVPNELRGLCLAILSAAISLFGVALGPMTVSMLSDAMGGPMMIGTALAIVCVVAGLLSTLVFGYGRRRFPPRTGNDAAGWVMPK